MASNASTLSSSALVAEVIDRGQVSAQQILVVGLCLVFNMIDGFDITAMAVVASAVSSDLVIAADQLGWIFSFALAGMMVGAMLLAPISDMVGRRTVIILSIALVGLSILLTANASSLLEFVILRFVSGMGAGAMLACQATLAAEYSPDKYRALSVAVVTSGYPMGAMLTSVIAGYILPDYGWRGMFWFGGALTVFMALLAWLLLPESLKYLFERRPAKALERVNRILRKLKREPIAAMPEVQVDSTGRGSFVGNMLKLLAGEHRKATLILWSAFFMCFCTLYFLMSWIPKLLDDAGYDPEVGRNAFLLFNLGGVLGIYLMGWLSTRFRLTNLIFLLSLLAAAGMVAFAWAPAGLSLMMSLILIIGIVQQGGFTGLYAVAAKIYPTEIRSTGVGWAIGLGRLGAVAGPAIAGYLIVAGFDMASNFIVFAVPMAIGGFIAYLLHVD